MLGYTLVLVVATAGYHQLEGWGVLDAIWMVAITFTTIGYGEVHPLSDAGRMLTLGLIGAGVSLHTYTFTQVTRYFVEGGLVQDLRARKQRRVMSKLSNHYIVVGLGRLGCEVAELLHHNGEDVVVIDQNAERLEAYEHATLKILGDGSSDRVLEAAEISKARGCAVATGSSAVNVFVVLSARQLNPSLYILTRVDQEGDASKALRAGADRVISPYRIGGMRMANSLLHPHSASFIEQAEAREFPDLWLRDVRIEEGAPCVGTLMKLDLRNRFGILVVAIRRPDGEMVATPGPEVSLGAGDTAVVAGRPDAIQAFTRAAKGIG
jgi:voltage-gated potassium channel